MVRQRIWGSVWCLVLIASMSMVSAQQGGGRGGRGGFGGGFGGPQTKLQLITNEAVQKELALEAAQTEKLKGIGAEVRKEGEALRGNFDFQGLRELPEEERNKKMAEFRTKSQEATAKLLEKFLPQVNEVLTDAQEERLQQISLQASGSAIYEHEDVVKALALTAEQKEKLAAVNKTYRDSREALGNAGRAAGPEAFAKMRALSETRDKDLKAVLTADQVAALDKMLGKTFDVAQLRGGGRGGRPGGRPQQ